MELLLVLVSSLQPLTNFTKNVSVGMNPSLDLPIEYFNVFEICAGVHIE